MMHDEQSEKAALGGFMKNPKNLALADSFEVSNFFTDNHRSIFAAIRKMLADGVEVNYLSLSQEMNKRNTSVSITYLMELHDDVPNSYDVRPALARLKEVAQLRSVLSIAEMAIQRAENGDLSEDILHDLQNSTLRQQEGSSQLRIMTAPEMAIEALSSLRERWDRPQGQMPGITTGISGLDEAMSGWRDGELTYVGALPGRGKTSFMVQCMYSALTCGIGVGCISLEMRRGQLWDRLTILKSTLDAYKFRDPRIMNPAEREAAKRSVLSLGDMPYQCIDQSGLRPAQISAVVRRMHSAGARIIFVDFVQIIQEDGKDRREAINRVSAALRDTCKSLNIPFVVLSQLARRDNNPNRRPTIQDLRESGNLEQDAHNVLLLYRPKDESGAWTGEDEIIIDKQREGLTGSIPVIYDSKTLTYKGR
jgi:replicative DNA helicase